MLEKMYIFWYNRFLSLVDEEDLLNKNKGIRSKTKFRRCFKRMKNPLDIQFKDRF